MTAHYWTAIYIFVALIIVYFPPRAATGMGAFIERHLGDSVGFYILHLGIVLVVVSGTYPSATGLYSTGQSLILAGTVALKLTSKPPTNGTPGTSPSIPNPPAEPPKP